MRGWLAFWFLVYGALMFAAGYFGARPPSEAGADESGLVIGPVIIALVIAGFILGSSYSW